VPKKIGQNLWIYAVLGKKNLWINAVFDKKNLWINAKKVSLWRKTK
jgi:hypothetical protein